MDRLTDQQLLRDYTERRSESAFAELVHRHVDLVYSAAFRMVRDSHLAEDVTQGAFIALAQNARQLTDRQVLSGWLHRTARNLAANIVRSDVRRRAREQEAAAMNELLSTESDASWEKIAPHLDAALDQLVDSDRDALLLRYFERKSAREIAQTFSISDDAAQKRVNRAVDRLREFFSTRNVTIGTSGLVVFISANAVQSAPITLAGSISAVAVAGSALHTSTTAIATKVIAMTTLQKAVIGATIAVAIATGTFQAHKYSQLREEHQALKREKNSLATQVRQMQHELDEATSRLTALQGSTSYSNPPSPELLKLRAEVARLTETANDPFLQSAKTVAMKVNLLKQRLQQTPAWQIPELQFISDKDWADAAWDTDLDTDDGVREALSKVRETAINKFLNEMMKAAMKKYLAANGNILPTTLTQLEPYFDVPVTDDMLQRYKLLQSGQPDNHATLVRLAVNADDDYDSNHDMSINGASGGRFNRVKQVVETAAADFTVDHNGQMPTDPSQVASYLKSPIDDTTVRKYLRQATPPPADALALRAALKAYEAANPGKRPEKASDLMPYATTDAQKAILLKYDKEKQAGKH